MIDKGSFVTPEPQHFLLFPSILLSCFPLFLIEYFLSSLFHSYVYMRQGILIMYSDSPKPCFIAQASPKLAILCHRFPSAESAGCSIALGEFPLYLSHVHSGGILPSLERWPETGQQGPTHLP